MLKSYIVCILFSTKFNKIYIGYSSKLIERFYSHNFLTTKGYTSRYSPWRVIHFEFFDCKKRSSKEKKT
ncbi:MAG: GIY-YIG nuclease family protein [Bacteroidetes bacterium]|nr:GIY-YIG nuclease family protein [Bacteroidota bacterium]